MKPDLRPFPMQDGPPIPWYLAEAIWTHLYRHSQPLDVIARRGGFTWSEVAYMWGSPDWRTTREQRQRCREQILAITQPDNPPIMASS